MDSLSPFIQNRRISMQDRSSPPYLRYDFPLSCCIYSKINIILFSRNSVVESLNVCVVWIRISIEIWIIFEFNLNRHVKFFFFLIDLRTCVENMHRLSLVLCFSSRIYLQIRAEKLFQMANLLIAAEINFGSYRLISQKNCTWKTAFLKFKRNEPSLQSISIYSKLFKRIIRGKAHNI